MFRAQGFEGFRGFRASGFRVEGSVPRGCQSRNVGMKPTSGWPGLFSRSYSRNLLQDYAAL